MNQLHISREKNPTRLLKFCIFSFTMRTPSFGWHLKSLHIFDIYIKFGLHVYIGPLYYSMFDISLISHIYFTETCNMKSDQ